MYFQGINIPSLPAIRAKFLVEKLKDFSQRDISINLCATGRTGSGKTTLGNRLIGLDYFMPSSGKQDCTDEVNMIEFPIGLRYYDLPGVCSNDMLENYNRSALGIKQAEDCPKVDKIVLSIYCEGQKVQKQHVTVHEFRKNQFSPDLIFYLIAPDKQFLAADCKYLKDLLRHYSQVIYILNIFGDKKNGDFAAATEQNIIDVVSRIKKIHNHVLGCDIQPVIIAVNCWTGEGFSDLAVQSCKMLGGEKGSIFQELLLYQQKKTPDEYLLQVKKELLKLFAYAACQKPDGSYSCDQSLHKTGYTLLDFLSILRGKTEQAGQRLTDKFNDLINRIIKCSYSNKNSFLSGIEENVYPIERMIDILSKRIEVINNEIDFKLRASQAASVEFLNKEIQLAKDKIQFFEDSIHSIDQDVKYYVEQYEFFRKEISSLKEEIQNHLDIHKSHEKSYHLLNNEIECLAKDYESSALKIRNFDAELEKRINNYTYRIDKLNIRINLYNSNIEKINRTVFTNRSTVESINNERAILEAEEKYINNEKYYIDQQIIIRGEKLDDLKSQEKNIDKKIAKRNKKEDKIRHEENCMDQLIIDYTDKIKHIQKIESSIFEKNKLRSQTIRNRDNYILFCNEMVKFMQKENIYVDENIAFCTREINSKIKTIYSFLEKNRDGEIIQNDIEFLSKKIYSCLENTFSFQDEINSLILKVKDCISKAIINKIIINIIMKCTDDHFDDTDACEYKGSLYKYFSRDAVVFLSSLSHLIASGEVTEDLYYKKYREINNNVYSDEFPAEFTEDKIYLFLTSKINAIFESSFDDAIRKIAQ